jgi:MOSC domain-containing protein YiiM
VTLEKIRRFRVPRDIVKQSERKLRKAGKDGYELFVLWSGRHSGDVFDVLEGHVPQQTSYKTEHGLVVRVEGEALHKLNVWLYENDQELAVQVHAHPTEAYHSKTDDTYPIVTTVGGISIVAAHFCRNGLFTDDTALYRLTADDWVVVGSDVVEVV